MSRFKQILLQLPEYYLVLVTLFAGYKPPFEFNSLFVLLAIILVVQIVLKHRISGFVLAVFFGVINLFMLGALISELFEFQTFDTNAAQLLFGGVIIWGLNMLFCGIMIYKYAYLGDQGNSNLGYHPQKIKEL